MHMWLQLNLLVHGLDQMKEDYQEPEKKQVLGCKECESTFSYKKNVNAHVRSKHSENAELLECDKCPSKFIL